MTKILMCLLCITAFTTFGQQNKNDPNLIKKYNKALKNYNREKDSLSNPAEFYYNRAGICEEYFDLTSAVAYYTKVIDINPDNSNALYKRGMAKLSLSLLKEAVSDFDKVIDLDPENIYAYNNRGICKDYMLNFPGAIRDYSTAIVLDANYAEAYNNRGISKIKMGQNDDGCDDLHTAMKLGDKKSELNIKKLCDKK